MKYDLYALEVKLTLVLTMQGWAGWMEHPSCRSWHTTPVSSTLLTQARKTLTASVYETLIRPLFHSPICGNTRSIDTNTTSLIILILIPYSTLQRQSSKLLSARFISCRKTYIQIQLKRFFIGCLEVEKLLFYYYIITVSLRNSTRLKHIKAVFCLTPMAQWCYLMKFLKQYI